MADPLTQIQKLIALAMDNPSAEESRSAALKAVALIVENNVTLNNRGARTFDDVNTKKVWTPDSEFEEFWEKTKAGADVDGVDPDLGYSSVGGGTGLKAAVQNTDLDDDFMRKRIKIAWKALTRERARLKREIEEEYCKPFQKKYPRPEPVDWEK